QDERQGGDPDQAQRFDHEPGEKKERRPADALLDVRQHRRHLGCLGPGQNWASASECTSCATSWHPLVRHDTCPCTSAISVVSVSVCASTDSNLREPPWQCRHSRLLYGW